MMTTTKSEHTLNIYTKKTGRMKAIRFSHELPIISFYIINYTIIFKASFTFPVSLIRTN